MQRSAPPEPADTEAPTSDAGDHPSWPLWWRFLGLWIVVAAVAVGIAFATGRPGPHRTLTFGAAFLGLAGAVHSLLGERFILMRLFARSEMPKVLGSRAFTRSILRFAWHLNTVAWWGLAAILLALRPGSDPDAVAVATAVTLGASAIVAAAGSRLRHPAWMVFAAAAATAWLAAVRP